MLTPALRILVESKFVPVAWHVIVGTPWVGRIVVVGKINVQTSIQVGGNQVVSAQTVFNYLAQCPWSEVVRFMVVPSRLRPVQDTSTEPMS
jgi:hypothetical protein